MKVFSISDLHLSLNNPKPMDIFGPSWNNYVNNIVSDWKAKVKDNDVVLIAGDISWAMKLEDAKLDLEFLSTLPGKKIIIKGNHDYWWKSISSVRSLLPDNFFALQNDFITIENLIFCGTRGWQVPEKNFKTLEDEKIFKRELIRLNLSLSGAIAEKQKLIKNGISPKIICLIHYPPFNSKLEQSEFTNLFDQYGVDCVVFGHIHSNKGKFKFLTKINNTKYYLTSCDLVGNKLVEIL